MTNEEFRGLRLYFLLKTPKRILQVNFSLLFWKQVYPFFFSSFSKYIVPAETLAATANYPINKLLLA